LYRNKKNHDPAFNTNPPSSPMNQSIHHQTGNPNKESAETRAARRAVTLELLHAFDVLTLRCALLPTRATPGLWAGIDG